MMKLYIGIDWSQNKHDLCYLNQAGSCLAQKVIPHSQEGFWQLEKLRQQLGVAAQECLVGIETTHNILVDFLWDQGYTRVYELHPNLVKSSRGRLRQSAARSDPTDAWLLADILRTDHHRLQAWQPDRLLTRQIRVKVKFMHFLTRELVRVTNRQRALLLRYYPAGAELFSSLKTAIAQHFLLAFPSAQTEGKLDREQLEAFLRQHHYVHVRKVPQLLARLQQAYPQADAEIVVACQAETQSLAHILLELTAAKKAAQGEVRALFAEHPDRHIYASLPGTGEYLQPALLAKFGDDRMRFPSSRRLQALAGTSPVTLSSGKRKRVRFRKACALGARSFSRRELNGDHDYILPPLGPP
ncbi:MAG: transposase [Chloroflexi bacterium]|nr:transposase [Chloroflexota bacterium]